MAATIKATRELKTATATEFRHRMELLLCEPDGDGYKGRVALDVRLMPAAEWEKLKKADDRFEGGKRVGRYEWSGVLLDTGFVLAIRGIDKWDKYRITQSNEEPFRERMPAMKRLRNTILDALTDSGEFVSAFLSAEGGAEFRVAVDTGPHPHPGGAKIFVQPDDEL